MKYILVTGGVISGIGKGVLSSSIGEYYVLSFFCLEMDVLISNFYYQNCHSVE